MAKKEARQRIDAQWQALQPGWGLDDYKGERRMLYDSLDDHENIEGLWSGGWKGLMNGAVMESHDRGIVAATSEKILLLNRGRLSKNISMIAYDEIKKLEDTGAGEVKFVGDFGFGLGYSARLSYIDTHSFENFFQRRLLNDTASVEAALSHVLDSGESVQFWRRCSGGEETVSERGRVVGPGGPGGTPRERWWEVEVLSNIIAVATDRRVLLVSDFRSGDFIGVPYANLLTVMQRDASVKFAGVGRSEVYVVQTSRRGARRLANLMQSNWTAQSRPGQKRPRILAEWQMHQPVWSHRNIHDKERTRLPEVMDDGERLEGLLGGHFQAEGGGETSHDGVIAATDRRLIFLSEGIFDKHSSDIPYVGLAEVHHEKGRIHHKVRFIVKPGYTGYRVSSVDDERPDNSRQSGYAEEFVALVHGFLGNSTAAAPTSNRLVNSAESKHARINVQWQERSPDWKLDTRKNEREKLYEVLHDDEDIELLIQGNYRLDQKGAESHDVVVAATDRRLIFVYNGWAGAHLNWMGYHQIESVEGESKLMGEKVTVVARGGLASYVVEIKHEEFGEWMHLFVECVRSHLGP